MTPLKLTLRHYCQHSSKEFIFTRGMNSIMGPNGAGKSTMIDALRLCLCLESGNPGKVSDNIQDGHERASLMLEFEHQGVTGRIHLQLKRNYPKNWDELSLEQEAARAKVQARAQDASVQVSDSCLQLSTLVPKEQMVVEFRYRDLTLTKVTEVREWIRNNIGYDPRVLSESYFPRQGDVDGALSGDRETRQRVFHEKAGTAICQKLWDELGKEIRGLPDYTAAPVREQELSLKEARARAEHQEWVERAQAARAAVPALGQAQQVLERFRLSSVETKRLEDMLARKADLAHQLSQEQARLAGVKEEGVRLASLTGAAAPRAQELQRVLEAQEGLVARSRGHNEAVLELEQARSSLEQAQESHTRLEGCPGIPTRDEVSRLWEAHAALVEELRQAEHFMSHFSTGTCPTCGQEVEDASQKTRDLANRVPVVRQAIAEAKALYERAVQGQQAHVGALTSSSTNLAAAQARVAAAEAALARNPPVVGLLPPGDLSRARGELAALVADQDRLVQLRQQYALVSTSVSGLESRVHDLEDQVAASRAALGQVPGADEARAASLLVEQHAAASSQAQEFETEAEVKARYLADVQGDLEQARAKVQQAAPVARWRAMLEQVRDLIHRDALPAEVVAWYADQLVRHTMTYLKMFESEFELFVARDLTLMAMFSDKTIPVCRLSGGQKNMLNISMRLAMVDMFPSQLQLLVLDEVEVHLDQRNVARLPVVLERVKGLARGKDLVVLFVSHHPSLAGVADHTINIQQE